MRPGDTVPFTTTPPTTARTRRAFPPHGRMSLRDGIAGVGRPAELRHGCTEPEQQVRPTARVPLSAGEPHRQDPGSRHECTHQPVGRALQTSSAGAGDRPPRGPPAPPTHRHRHHGRRPRPSHPPRPSPDASRPPLAGRVRRRTRAGRLGHRGARRPPRCGVHRWPPHRVRHLRPRRPGQGPNRARGGRISPRRRAVLRRHRSDRAHRSADRRRGSRGDGHRARPRRRGGQGS